MSNIARAQIVISAHPKEYSSGKNISCHGNSDGEIEIEVNGGNGPYWFNWKKAPSNQSISFNQNIYNLGAGEYTVKVTDQNSNTETATITLVEPNSLNIQLVPGIYGGGYNINEQGAANGSIECHVSGGTELYSYLWNDPAASTTNIVNGLTAGTYSVQVTDMMGCSANESVTLTEPSQLHIINISSPLHNGYNVSCYNGEDGAINISVGGGVPPYHYQWAKPSYESTAQNPSGLKAGHYSIIVRDQNDGIVVSQIILTAPPDFRITSLTPVVYPPQNKNLSCNSCSNGSLAVNFTGGIGNKNYQWENTQTNQILNQLTQTVTNLAAGTYKVTVTDANGCSASGEQGIVAPERDDWSMMGNAGILSSQFIGSTDSSNLVFKTNNTERLTIKGNGIIDIKSPLKISSPLSSNYNSVYVNNAGVITLSSPPINPCFLAFPDIWYHNSCNSTADIFLRSPFTRVGIGTATPLTNLDVAGGIRSGNLSGATGFNIVKVESDGIFSTLPPPTNYASQNILHGDGTWGLLPTGASSWISNGTSIYCNPLSINIGIGTQSPNERLEVNGTGRFTSLSNANKFNTFGHDGVRGFLNSTDDLFINSSSGKNVIIGGTGGASNLVVLGTASINKDAFIGGQIYIDKGVIQRGGSTINSTTDLGLYSLENTKWLRFVTNNAPIRFFTDGGTSSIGGNPAFSIEPNGQIGIGTTNFSCTDCSDYSLFVKKGIRTEKIKVDIASSNNWADFAFNKNYKLLSILNLKKFIDKNNHLPDIPSLEEVKKNGIDLVDFNVKLLLKVEELTLYVIQLKEENEEIKKEMNDLRKKH